LDGSIQPFQTTSAAENVETSTQIPPYDESSIQYISKEYVPAKPNPKAKVIHPKKLSQSQRNVNAMCISIGRRFIANRKRYGDIPYTDAQLLEQADKMYIRYYDTIVPEKM
jgi:hypothetical protein